MTFPTEPTLFRFATMTEAVRALDGTGLRSSEVDRFIQCVVLRPMPGVRENVFVVRRCAVAAYRVSKAEAAAFVAP